MRYRFLFAGPALLSASLVLILPAQTDTPAAPPSSPNTARKDRPHALPDVRAGKPSGEGTDRPVKTRIVTEFGKLPLAFERNQGQTDAHVRFLAHTRESTLCLTPSEAVFRMPVRSAPRTYEALGKRASRSEARVLPGTIRMQVMGGNPHAQALEEQPLAGRANYFFGSDPGRWQTDVPTFGRVRFREVYRGVDLVYYGDRQRLEYDFVVAPYADPKQIRLHFAGAQEVHLNPAGDLIVQTPDGALTWRRPTVYQRRAGGAHVAVPSRFRLMRRLHGGAEVAFALGRYDVARPLVIDPVLLYSTYLGGSALHGGDFANDIAVDDSGSAYITGYTGSLDFPVSASYQRGNRSGAGITAFVAKLDPTGAALLYATYLGGSRQDNANAIAVDGSGSAYITGRAFSGDFPTTSGAFQRTLKADHNAFVTKLSPSGSALVYSTYLGGSRSDSAVAIAIDGAGHAFVTGHTISSDFPTTAGALQTVNRSPGGGNAFVTELDPTGAKLLYSTYLGGSSPAGDFGKAITVDSSGSVYLLGDAFSADLPVTSGAYQKTHTALNSSNAFVAKFNPVGTALVYSTYLGGSGTDNGNSIGVDSAGQAYVAGNTLSTDFPTTSGAFQRAVRTKAGVVNAYVTRLSAAGDRLLYSTYLGGSAETYTYHLAIDPQGEAYITGYTDATDFPTTVGAYRRSGVGATIGKTHSYVARLNAAGSALIYSTYLGGTGGDYASSLALDSRGAAYITGYTNSADFPVTASAVQSVNRALSAAASNAFVTKLLPLPVFPDLDGDGNADLLLQNASSGAMAGWFMNGTQWQGGVYFSQTPPAGYTLVGSGDFRGDGTPALVLQNRSSNAVVLWYTGGANHAAITGGDYVDQIPANGWNLVGVADFNGDGRSDLVFQNQSTHQIAIWLMVGAHYQGGVLLPVVPPSGWSVVGTGDINGDGFPDLIFQNQSSGQIAVWYMNGTAYGDGLQMKAVPAAGWKVVGVGDYNRDGFADLLLQNQTNDQAVIWFLQNGAFAGGDTLSLTPPAGWKVAGPR